MTDAEIVLRAKQMAGLYDRRNEASTMFTEAKAAYERMKAIHDREEQAARGVMDHAEKYLVSCEYAPVQLQHCKETRPELFDISNDPPRLTPEALKLVERPIDAT